MVTIYCKEIETRTGASERCQDLKNTFLQQECDLAKSIIERNFSNYSAWHYRGKLMPLITQAESCVYALPLSVIEADLKQLKHAYFTDPKDQGPWNYHAWLMSLLSPIQVVAVRYLSESGGRVGFAIGLSHQVKRFESLEISLVNGQGNPVAYEVASAVAQRSSLSNTWSISFDASEVGQDRNQFTLSLAQAREHSAETAEGHSLFRKCLLHLDVNRNAETDQLHATFEHLERQLYVQANPLLTTLNTVLAAELENIRELTGFEEGL